MLGLWLIAGLLVFGWVVGLAWRLRGAMIAVAWAGFVALHLLVPASDAAQAIGGSARGWLVLGGVVGVVLAYRAALSRLRARAVPLDTPAPRDGITDSELDRYARHIVLREVGGPGQMRLRDARVLIVGAGGLGAPVCLYLAAAGVGRITVADDDRITLSNLQRQVIFRTDQCGEGKADTAAAAMSALNPHCQVTPLNRRVTGDDADLIAAHDLVIDGTDRFAARDAINRACVAAGVPLIAGAIAQWDGQVTLYDPARGGPCLACLFPDAPAPGLAPPCAESGVIGPLPGVIGSLMAFEAVKHLTGAGQGLRGRMMMFDGLYGDTRMIETTARAGCLVCGTGKETA
ncbi:HesA/MoeB/ThiF family protein [Paracoccus sp. (in: a-proteobacteria)]|uniref:HesA/MoeB/ThiF family protein n=1 Tax=Paracoccus sp. TaxID=267 RepID=UPI0026E0CE02|nr:HesA/MoeB/ThiF family protein [Paracoccus sp. (in: a-proteobacteria)]MDO5646467.1 HesA/MoeB/ThiF family protein [Paracoccus sp. (in: a-proteobacteria)]